MGASNGSEHQLPNTMTAPETRQIYLQFNLRTPSCVNPEIRLWLDPKGTKSADNNPIALQSPGKLQINFIKGTYPGNGFIYTADLIVVVSMITQSGKNYRKSPFAPGQSPASFLPDPAAPKFGDPTPITDQVNLNNRHGTLLTHEDVIEGGALQVLPGFEANSRAQFDILALVNGDQVPILDDPSVIINPT